MDATAKCQRAHKHMWSEFESTDLLKICEKIRMLSFLSKIPAERHTSNLKINIVLSIVYDKSSFFCYHYDSITSIGFIVQND